MLFDHRTYECRPGTLKAHLALYGEYGYGPQVKHLGKPLLYAFTETGTINTYTHIWVFESAGDREAKRAAMWADADWLQYIKRSGEAGYLIRQENKLLTPTDFFEMR
jgi:hypothetical protein